MSVCSVWRGSGLFPGKASKNMEDVARWRMVRDDLGKMKSIRA